MIPSRWLFGILALLCSHAIAHAGILDYEGFNYPAGSNLNLQNGGTGWSGPWGTPGGLDATIDAASLSFGSLSVSGGALSTAGFQPPDQGSSVATWIRSLGTPLGADDTTVYLSFLFRPDPGFGFYGGLNFGNLFVGLSGNQSFYGLEGPANDLSLSTVPDTVGQTVLFVLRADFLPGDDSLSLYVNPVPGQPEPATPDVLKTDLDVGTVNDIVINNYGGFTTDEIRIGSTFDSVTPLQSPAPEPGLGLVAGMASLWLLGSRRRARRQPAGSICAAPMRDVR